MREVDARARKARGITTAPSSRLWSLLSETRQIKTIVHEKKTMDSYRFEKGACPMPWRWDSIHLEAMAAA